MNQPIFFLLGTLAAHATEGRAGFRQRELRFYAELFSNWVQSGGIGSTYAIHNTQVSRFLSSLVSDHQAKQLSRTQAPRYRLTRTGLYSITAKISARSYLDNTSHCYLVWYFLKSYAGQIKNLMIAAGSDFSRAHQIEMEQLLDTTRFVNHQLQFIEQEIMRLKSRVNGTLAIETKTQQLKKKGAKRKEIIEEISRAYPYELNSQRPFNEVLEHLPDTICDWEIGVGATLRAKVIFEPLLQDLTIHQQRLRQLLT